MGARRFAGFRCQAVTSRRPGPCPGTASAVTVAPSVGIRSAPLWMPSPTSPRCCRGAEQAKAEGRSWWPDSHTRVLDDADALLACATPTGVEDAVCDLLGRHWQGLYAAYDAGLRADEWLEGLLDVAKPRAGEPAVRRLLYGVALIATPGLAGLALDVLRHTSDGCSHDGEPAWLAVPPTVTASPDVLLLRDAYGLRFGVLTQVTGPGGPPRTYLYDIDLCHDSYQVGRQRGQRSIDRSRQPSQEQLRVVQVPLDAGHCQAPLIA